MKAKKLPSGNWRVQASTGERGPSGRYAYMSFTAPTAAEAELAALEHKVRRGEAGRDPADMTLGEAMGRYVEAKGNVLSPSTIRGYNVIRRNNLASIMQVKLGKLNNNVIQSAINDESRSNSPKTVKNACGLMGAVLALYHPDFKMRVTLPKKERKEVGVMSVEQAKMLFKAVEGQDIEIPVLLAAWLGLRESEITGLKWDCVDLGKKVMTVKNALVRGENGYVLKPTKTYSSTRKLKIPEFIAKKLERAEKTGEFVVKTKNNMIYKKFKRILGENNLPTEIRFHDLRHFNASVMLQLNIPDKYAMARGGWSTDSTMKNIYQHTFDEVRESVDDAVDGYFENLVKPV